VNSGTELKFNGTLATQGNTVSFSGAGNVTFAAAGTMSGGGGFAYSGSGTLALGGAANTNTGANSISSGTVKIGVANGLGAVATTVLNMTGTGTLNTSGFAQTLLALSGTSNTTIQNTTGTSTLTLTPVANSNSIFAGTFK